MKSPTLILVTGMLLICGQAYAAESVTPPDNMQAHRKWAVATDA
jgi:hypothetical protein